MATAPSPIDWRRAEQVARRVAARAPVAPSSVDPSALLDAAGLAEDRVAEVTGLRPPTAASTPGVIRLIDRETWAATNVASFRRLLEPLVERWQESASARRAPLGGGAAVAVAATIAGAELGAIVGWMSTRVLGQYDVLVGSGATGDDAVYLVEPNLAGLERRFGFEPEPFRLWVLLHELTHRAQFAGVPWMRDHFAGLVERSVAAADPDPSALLRALRDALADRAAAQQRLRSSGIAGLMATAEQRALLERIGGLMSLLEGHGDVTMDRAGEGIVPDAERYGRVLRERRRKASPAAKLVQRLIGIEGKLEQYAAGARFIAEVEAVGGPRAIDRCWAGPDQLPSLDEIREPARWLERVGVEPATATVRPAS